MTSDHRRIALPRRETVTSVLAVLVAMALCTVLGLWQWHRFEDRKAAADTVAANYDAAPSEISQILGSPDDRLSADQDWTPVTLDGEYCTDPECVLYVRNRPLDGSVGFWQLVPFETADGTVLIVRGWIDGAEVGSVPVEQPEIPRGPITVTAHLRPAEPVLEDRTNPPGQVQSVAPEQFAQDLPVTGPVYTGTYGDLMTEEPTEIARPEPLEAPSTGLGPHLSYAFQWWVFALFFPAALVVRSRRAAADARRLTETGSSPSSAPSAGRESGDAVETGDAVKKDGTVKKDGAVEMDGAVEKDSAVDKDAVVETGVAAEMQGATESRSPASRRTVPAAHGTSPERRVRRRTRSQDEEEEDALVDEFRS